MANDTGLPNSPLEARVASAGQGGAFHVEVDGADATGPMLVPNTGGWQNWQTISRSAIPLTAGPGATLGPEIKINIPRPRDRKAINHHARFKEIRRELITFMLDSKGEGHTSITKKLILPDIEPEDLGRPPRIYTGGARPKRAS